MKHPIFIKPQIVKRQVGGQVSIVSYDVVIGDKIHVGLDAENRVLYKQISEIHETRPSRGEFPNHERPNYYLVTLTP